jgi:pantothenate kinase-related protein Tda10
MTDIEILRSLAFPQMLDRRDNVELCHTNTCQWILDLAKYQSWRRESPGLLWIKGKPGSGKFTSLIQKIQDRIQRRVYFTKYDITDVYNRLRIKEDDK